MRLMLGGRYLSTLFVLASWPLWFCWYSINGSNNNDNSNNTLVCAYIWLYVHTTISQACFIPSADVVVLMLCCVYSANRKYKAHLACLWCSLSMLQKQCELWSGPIAAVAYMPLLKGKLVSMDDAALNGTTVEEQKAKLAMFYETVTHAGQYAVETNTQLLC